MVVRILSKSEDQHRNLCRYQELPLSKVYNIHDVNIPNSTVCSKKRKPPTLLAITFSNLSRFSKFFHCWKGNEISNRTTYYFLPHLKHVSVLPWESWKVQIYCKLQQKNQKASHIWQKWNVYVVIWLTGDRRIVFYSICSKCPPFTCTHARDACASHQLHCQWCSGRRYATLAANDVSVRQCHAPATGRLAAGLL